MGLAIVIFFVFTGHIALWIAILNRVHGLPIPPWVIHTIEKVICLVAISVPGLAAWLEFESIAPILQWTRTGEVPVLTAYAGACGLIWSAIVPTWLWRYWLKPAPSALLSNDTTRIRIDERVSSNLLGSWKTQLMVWIPGNEMLQLHIHHKRLQLAQLPRALNGLSIAHLSDLHFTGAVRQEYFKQVVAETNALQPDLIAISGDIIDKERCLPWIQDVLGKLVAKHGKFFVLGNHDQRLIDTDRVRRALVECGFIDVAHQCHECVINGERILLAGNERPWFRQLPEIKNPPPIRNTATNRDVAVETVHELRVLLAHTPDQIGWARAHRFDLMLAGHTHGGQVRFPLVGPVLTPSLFGVKYASGVFVEPPTLMHVSRGISGVEPLRINCAPEIALLELTSASEDHRS